MKAIWESSPVRFVREMVDMYFSKNVSRSAAELAYFLILTFFPVLICVNGFVGLLKLDPVERCAALRSSSPGAPWTWWGSTWGISAPTSPPPCWWPV